MAAEGWNRDSLLFSELKKMSQFNVILPPRRRKALILLFGVKAKAQFFEIQRVVYNFLDLVGYFRVYALDSLIVVLLFPKICFLMNENRSI